MASESACEEAVTEIVNVLCSSGAKDEYSAAMDIFEALNNSGFIEDDDFVSLKDCLEQRFPNILGEE